MVTFLSEVLRSKPNLIMRVTQKISVQRIPGVCNRYEQLERETGSI